MQGLAVGSIHQRTIVEGKDSAMSTKNRGVMRPLAEQLAAGAKKHFSTASSLAFAGARTSEEHLSGRDGARRGL